MNPLTLAREIVRHLKRCSALSAVSSNIFVQRVPPNASLPYLSIVMDDFAEQSFVNLPPNHSAQMCLTLASSLTDSPDLVTELQDAITVHLNQKQLVFQDKSTTRLITSWLEQSGDMRIEHDRIELVSQWQVRCH